MKKSTGDKVKLGIFIVVSLMLFISGVYFLGKKQQLFGSTFRVVALFKDVSGLQIGNNVRFAGINVGVVKNIYLIADSTVRVEMVINDMNRKFMKKSLTAIVGADGLMGNKIMLLLPGVYTAALLENNDVITTAQPIGLDDILKKVKITSDNAASITGDLAAITKNVREGKGTLGKFIMDDKFADNIDHTFTNIKRGTDGFNNNMDAVSHSFFLKRFFKRKNKKALKAKLKVTKIEE